MTKDVCIKIIQGNDVLCHFILATLYCNHTGVICLHKVMRILLFRLIGDKHERKLLMHSGSILLYEG